MVTIRFIRQSFFFRLYLVYSNTGSANNQFIFCKQSGYSMDIRAKNVLIPPLRIDFLIIYGILNDIGFQKTDDMIFITF